MSYSIGLFDETAASYAVQLFSPRTTGSFTPCPSWRMVPEWYPATEGKEGPLARRRSPRSTTASAAPRPLAIPEGWSRQAINLTLRGVGARGGRVPPPSERRRAPPRDASV